jgi:PPIC-type PPIASE domain
MSRLSRLAREPLVQFLLIGALLFTVYAVRGPAAGPDSRRIVVSGAQVDYLATNFARTWQRPPTTTELKGLVDDYVREEIAVREAMAMGLDRDDTIMRRRLRQKLEFVTQDVIDSVPATADDLERWYQDHLDAYSAESEIAFRQVFIDRDRRGASARAAAEQILAELRQQSDVDAADRGDVTMLPASMPASSVSEVARTFGQDFADRVLGLEPGRWQGPVESSFGLHLVFVDTETPAYALDFAAVAPLVERDFLADRRKRELDAFYAKLLERYDVVLDFDDTRTSSPDQVAAGSDGSARSR